MKEARHRKITPAWSHLRMESKKLELIKVESTMVVAEGLRNRENGGGEWIKGTKFQLRRMIKFWGSNVQQ